MIKNLNVNIGRFVRAIHFAITLLFSIQSFGLTIVSHSCDTAAMLCCQTAQQSPTSGHPCCSDAGLREASAAMQVLDHSCQTHIVMTGLADKAILMDKDNKALQKNNTEILACVSDQNTFDSLESSVNLRLSFSDSRIFPHRAKFILNTSLLI